VLKEIYGNSTLMASFYDDKEKSKGRIDIRSN
jgi:hypothetical protein